MKTAEAIPSLSAPAFAALDGRGVRWARLRDDDPDAPFAEVDLLVAAGDLGAAADAFADAGFVALDGRGLGSHRFFVACDAATGGWHKLDVVTDLAFGRRREVPVASAEALLARRVRTAGGWRLAPADAFWALAFHCLLDRHALPAPHRTRLAQLAAGAGDSPLTAPLAGTGLGGRIVEAAAAGDADALLGCAAPLRRVLVRSWPAPVLARLAGHAGRKVAANVTIPRRPGFVVALLGPDGSGKSTLAAGLRTALPLRTRLLYGGLYAGRQGPLRRLVHLARFALAARYEARRGGVVLADRHPLEVPDPKPGRRASLRRRLFRAAPRPDLTLVLDCDATTMFRRKGEHTPEQLEEQRRRLLALVGRLPAAAVLDGRQAPDDVRAAASLAIWDQLRRRPR